MANFVVALLVIGLGSLALTLAPHVAVLVVRRRRPPEGAAFPISVLKPLKGADAELYENLVSFARQKYPSFELVLGCEDPFDCAVAVARRVAREFPQVVIKVVCGDRQIGRNPKVNNLARLARFAEFEHLLVSDADVRVGTEYLSAVAAEMSDLRVGLVSNVIAAVSDGSFPSAVEGLHVNTFIARAVCGADVFAGHPCVIGKSMLFRRSDLERLGGLAVVKDVLAEDYVLGQLFRGAGHRVVLSPYAIHTVNAPRGARELMNRHVRWSQMRRHLAPWLYWGEPLLMPALWLSSALFALCLDPCGAGSSARPVVGLATAGLCLLGIADALLVRTLSGRSFDARWLVLGPIRDIAAALVWVVGAFRRTVVWRGNVFSIGEGSVLTPYSEGAPDAELGHDEVEVVPL
jgi:ceramide glucosyltransferase